jgi:Cytochrome c554 and c-prime
MQGRRYILLAIILAGCHETAPAPTPLPSSALMDPATCKDCHPKHYREWVGSMHAYASNDPLFRAMNARAQRDGAGSFCVKCHAPMAVHTGATRDGLNLAEVPAALQGVTCYFCHNSEKVLGTHNNPLFLADDGVMRGPHRDAAPNSAHASAYSLFHDREQRESADLCGSCHDVLNRHFVAVERTYEEWKESAFSSSTPVGTCGRCHMAESEQVAPIAEGVRAAPLRKYHSHTFAGVDLALVDWPEREAQKQAVQRALDDALRMSLCVRGTPASPADLMVTVANTSGHKWPSGAAQHRRLWFEVTAYKDERVVYRTDGEDVWMLGDSLFDGAGQRTHRMWEAVTVESTLLPPWPTRVQRSFPRTGALAEYPDRVTLQVRLQPFPLDFFDELFAAPEELGLTAGTVQAIRATLVPLTVGPQLEWTPERAGSLAVSCVSGEARSGSR